MDMTKELNLKNAVVTCNQYYGNVYFRLYDTKTGKNIAKLETNWLMDLMNSKLKNGDFIIEPKGKGNTLPVIRLISGYHAWGTSELIEKCENAEHFAREIAQYFDSMQMLTETDEYLLERANEVAGIKLE